MLLSWDKLYTLVWKQWLIEKRNPFKWCLEMTLPLMVSVVLLFMNIYFTNELEENTIFTPYKTGISNTSFPNTSELIFCPNNSVEFERLIFMTTSILGIDNVKSFKNEDEMHKYVSNEAVQERLFSAIQFHGVNSKQHQDLPRKLQVSLRFPEFRIVQGHNTSWLTDKTFPSVFGVLSIRRNNDDNYGPVPNYQRKGFLILQEALSLAYIKLINPGAQIPNILMQRHPYPSWTRQEVYDSETTVLNAVLFMFLSYIFLFIGVIKLVTQEKEMQMKQALKIAGVSNSILWSSYFIRSLALFLFCFSILLLALNIPPSQCLIQFSNSFIIFLFFFCFSAASITLAFLVSIVNSSTVAATIIGAILWFISFVPYYHLKIDIFGSIMAFIFAPLTFFHAFDIIFTYEFIKEGLQWNNLWKYPSPKHYYTFGHLLLSLLGCTVIYLMVAVFIESGKLQKILIFWRKKCKCCKCYSEIQSTTSNYFDDTTVVQEQPPSNLPLIVKLINLRKVYSKRFQALENVSLEIYEHQITILMGPNGAGKTTVANIIVGIIKPTQGTAKIYKSNVRKLLGENQTYIGYCPQISTLFDELTVEEHIYFFSRIKGFDCISSIEETNKYISLLQLGEKASTTAQKLTLGFKRRLSVALALCAHSRLVVLDEPTAGIDPVSKRTIWNALNAEKKNRSIFITTHLIEEAEMLGDRIAIICEGILKCCGSNRYLKHQYAEGYRLIIVKDADCRTSRILNFIRQHAPNVSVSSDVGAQLCFTLKKQYASVIEKLLQDLEANQDYLAIQSLRISMPTLEDVFNKNTIGQYTVPFDEIEEESMQFLVGRKLFLNRIFALLLKKLLLFKISWQLILLHIVFVVILIIISEFSIFHRHTYNKPKFKVSLKTYIDPVLIVHGKNIFKESYVAIANKYATIIDSADITETIFKHMKKDAKTVLYSYPAGASFLQNNTIIVWYNSFPFHSAPLALNLVMNAILRYYSQSSLRSIEIFNHPLPLTNLHKALRTDTKVYGALQYLMAVYSSMFIIFVIREAVSKSRNQQYVCGINPIMYWLTTFLCDFTVYIMLMAIVMITLTWLPHNHYSSSSPLGQLFLILMCYGFASLHLGYLLNRVFTTPSTGYVSKILFATFGIILATLLQHIEKFTLLEKWVSYIFMFLPTFCLAYTLDGLNQFQEKQKVCTMLYESCMKYTNKENCTKIVLETLSEKDVHACERSLFTMNTFIPYLLALVCFGTAYALINVIIDTPLIPRTLNKYYKRKFRQIRDEEEDVLREREWVKKASIRELSGRTIVLKDICKIYKRNIALNRVSLAISPYECFGLIGAHGSGKTTVFRIVTGDMYTYTGTVLIDGLNMITNTGKIRMMTVYCPQNDSLFLNLTGEENLIFYALIRGVPYKQTKQIAKMIAQKLDFWRYLERKVRHYSGGNKRKLSAAIALMGNAKIIFLDEPGAGMDISTSKHLWAAICDERKKGTSILLSTHSMEECEAVCNRVGVLVKGRIVCIGSPKRLANKFAKGYILNIRCKREIESEVDWHRKLMSFMKEELPTAELLESFMQVYTFQIRTESSLSWAMVFHIIDSNKTFLNIEDYTLTQFSLEQAFLSVSY